MKRTLKRELKVPEIAEREANGTSSTRQDCHMPSQWPAAINASVVAGFERYVCGVSCLVGHLQLAVEENFWDVVTSLRGGECSGWNSTVGCLLTKWFHPTRLETRTKESNIYASIWVANPYAK